MEEQHKRKISEALIGRFRGIHRNPSTEFKKGFTPWNKNIKLPQFQRQNLGVVCTYCHNAIHDTPNRKSTRFQKGHLYKQHTSIILQ